MKIADRFKEIGKEIEPYKATLVAVSKTHKPEVILEAYNAGQRIFGENKVQELVNKAEVLPKDIQWHMIGHLQTNKVKLLLPHVALIHSIDSEKLLLALEKEAGKLQKPIQGLLQVHIATEETKFGWSAEELISFMQNFPFDRLKWLKIVGLMGMATFTSDEAQVEEEFESLQRLNNEVKESFEYCKDFSVLSTGMSGDYRIALKRGSTMVRIGSKLFGERNYTQA